MINTNEVYQSIAENINKQMKKKENKNRFFKFSLVYDEVQKSFYLVEYFRDYNDSTDGHGLDYTKFRIVVDFKRGEWEIHKIIQCFHVTNIETMIKYFEVMSGKDLSLKP